MVTTRPPVAGHLRTILVAVDDAAGGERVLRFAIALALRHGADVSIVTALDRAGIIAGASADGGGYVLGSAVIEELEATATSMLATMARRAATAGVSATTATLDGRAAPAIVARAAEAGVDAIVVGTRATHGLERFFLGSTADGVLRHANVPTFVIPPSALVPAPLARIFVAVDESDASDAASAFALGLAAAEGAALYYCSVVDTRDLFAKATAYGYDPTDIVRSLRSTATALLATRSVAARERTLAVESGLAEGDPANVLIAEAARHRADVIVVGTHGRRGVHRLLLGSVAETIVSRSSLPVLIVRAVASDRPKDPAVSALALAVIG